MKRTAIVIPRRLRLTLRATVLAALVASAPIARAQTTGPRITADVVYGHKDGLAMTFDVYTPPSPNGAGILFMVSGGWVSTWVPPEQLLPRLEALLGKGFTVFAVRHGSSPRYKVPDAAADVERAVRFIKLHAARFGVDPTRLGAHGTSAGGHLSLLVGLDPDRGDPTASDAVRRAPSGVAAVVAFFPPVDLTGMTGPSDRFPALDFPSELAASVSPIQFVSADDPPVLLIHGDADTLVPIAHSQRLHTALKDRGVVTEFVTLEGAGHGFGRTSTHGARATALMVAWFERHLLKK